MFVVLYLFLQPSLSKAISQVQNAQKALSNRDGKHPDVNEIAKFTGLTAAKIISASKCLRVVGSVDQKVGDFTNAKFLVCNLYYLECYCFFQLHDYMFNILQKAKFSGNCNIHFCIICDIVGLLPSILLPR